MADFIYNQKASTYNDHLVNYAGELGLFKKDLSKLQEILHNQGVDIEDGKFSKLVDKLEARMESIEKRESGSTIATVYNSGAISFRYDSSSIVINVYNNNIYFGTKVGFYHFKLSEPFKNLKDEKDKQNWADDYNYKNYIMSTDKKRYYKKNDAIYSDLITSNPGGIVKCEAVDFSKSGSFKFTQNYIIPSRAEKNGSFSFLNLKTSTVQKVNIPSISTEGVVPLPMDLVEMEKDDGTKVLLDLKTNTFKDGEWVKTIIRSNAPDYRFDADYEYTDLENNTFKINVDGEQANNTYRDRRTYIKLILSDGSSKEVARRGKVLNEYSGLKIKGGVFDSLSWWDQERHTYLFDSYIIKPNKNNFGVSKLMSEDPSREYSFLGRHFYSGDYIVMIYTNSEIKIISTGYEKEGR